MLRSIRHFWEKKYDTRIQYIRQIDVSSEHVTLNLRPPPSLSIKWKKKDSLRIELGYTCNIPRPAVGIKQALNDWVLILFIFLFSREANYRQNI